MKYPLKDEEINALVKEYRQFKRQAKKHPELEQDFQDFKNHFIQKLIFLVEYRAKRYEKFGNYQDLQQEGVEALFMALNTFQSSKGNFSWWADKYIKTRLSRVASHHSTIRIPIAHGRKLKPNKIVDMPILINTNQDVVNEIIENQEKKIISQAIQALPPIHNKVISMIYGCNGIDLSPQSLVLEELNLTRKKYLEILDEAKDQLREILICLEN